MDKLIGTCWLSNKGDHTFYTEKGSVLKKCIHSLSHADFRIIQLLRDKSPLHIFQTEAVSIVQPSSVFIQKQIHGRYTKRGSINESISESIICWNVFGTKRETRKVPRRPDFCCCAPPSPPNPDLPTAILKKTKYRLRKGCTTLYRELLLLYNILGNLKVHISCSVTVSNFVPSIKKCCWNSTWLVMLLVKFVI